MGLIEVKVRVGAEAEQKSVTNRERYDVKKTSKDDKFADLSKVDHR